RPKETSDSLAPRFLFALDEHAIASRFELRRRLFDIVHIELEPGLRNRNVVGPGILAKTGLRRLRKWPQGKTLGALQRLRMKIPVTLLFKGNAERLAVERATSHCIADDRAKAR